MTNFEQWFLEQQEIRSLSSPDWNLPDYNQQSKMLRPFERAYPIPKPYSAVEELAKAANLPARAMANMFLEESLVPLFKNGGGPGDIQVAVNWEGNLVEKYGNRPLITHLSFKRIDREPMHDWRLFQEIKNMIVGPEYEAVELYPAESRVVDTANQYHLWVFGSKSAKVRIGDVGFSRGIRVNESAGGSKQRARVEA